MQESDKQVEIEVAPDEDTSQDVTSDETIETIDVEEIEEVAVEPDEPISKPSIKSSDELIDEARGMVEESDGKVKDCLEILDGDIGAFEEEKSRVVRGSVHKSEALLSEVGFRADDIENMAEDSLSFGNEESAKSMKVEPLSSGKFGAFILAIVAGVVTVLVWAFVAMQKLQLPVDMKSISDETTIDKILLWIGGGITGGEGSAIAGIAILIASALLVVWLVYKAKVIIRENSNKNLAKKVHSDAKFYCTKKEECQREMERIGEHINQVTESLKSYDIFFKELNGKLQRAFHLEGDLTFGEYHPKTKEDMKQTYMLISSLKELLSTPMASQSGLLSDEAVEALEKSNYSLELYKEKLYK